MSPLGRQSLILVTDDDPELRNEVIPEALKRFNAKILTAGNVLDAFLAVALHHSWSSEPLDLIVLDMDMPLHGGTSETARDAGIQFLLSFRILPSLKRAICPVVVFTAYPSYQNCVRATQAGAVAYLPKSSQDSCDGPEGGIDHLVETCCQLLSEPANRDGPSARVFDWVQQNWDWLRKEFGGRWVALVPEADARCVGLEGVPRQGLIILAREREEDLAMEVMTKIVPNKKPIPLISRVPETGSQAQSPADHNE